MTYLHPTFDACWRNVRSKDCLATSGASILSPRGETILARLTFDYRWFFGNRAHEQETWFAQGVIIDSTIHALGSRAHQFQVLIRRFRRPPTNLMFPNDPPWATVEYASFGEDDA